MGFDDAYKHTKQFEGGYVNDPADRGGETFKGISRVNHPNWAGWSLIDNAKAAGIKSPSAINKKFADDKKMDQLVTEFYKAEFWEKTK